MTTLEYFMVGLTAPMALSISYMFICQGWAAIKAIDAIEPYLKAILDKQDVPIKE